LKDDIGEYLCDILKKFKNLKKINISNNRIYSGISLFLNQLKLLYRKKKSKLENLNINKCSLDKISIYELCELLKSKYCKLKKLYLNLNDINDDIADPLLEAIKKNNSLEEIYLGRNFIGNRATDKICKIISRPYDSLNTLYLNNNEINNNDNLLRIIARTKIIYSKEEDKNNIFIDLYENKILHNLDISNNYLNMKNINQIKLLKNLVDDTYLSCLDYSVNNNFFALPETFNGEYFAKLKEHMNTFIEQLNNIKKQRNALFQYIDEMTMIINNYKNIFYQYINNEKIKNILIETLRNKNMISIFKEKDNINKKQFEDFIENLISNELLEAIGKAEKDLLNDDNYYFIKNIIKYMLLYEINGGLINNWLRGINKCLIIF
jgi:hypothetical protein